MFIHFPSERERSTDDSTAFLKVQTNLGNCHLEHAPPRSEAVYPCRIVPLEKPGSAPPQLRFLGEATIIELRC